MKKYIMILLLSIGFSQQGEVTNVIADQRTDGSHLVDIYYDLLEDETFISFTVHAEISFDEGQTWHMMPQQIIPNILGDNVMAGEAKYFVYDLGEHANQLGNDFSGFSDLTQIKIVAYGHLATELPPGFEMVLIEAGDFTYGEGDTIKTIAYDYEIFKYEVTNAQYLEYLMAALADGVIYVEPNGYAGYDSADLYGYYSGDPNSDASDDQFLFSFRGPYYWDNAISWNTCEDCEFGAIPVINQGYGDHPVNGVSPEGARAFCEYYGLRLTNEYEWEKAARGMTGYDYPWGDSWDSSYLNHSESGDPWEGGILSDGPLVGTLAATTPAGYYNGTTYTYPDGFPNGEDQDSYATSESASPYGVYDLSGNGEEWAIDDQGDFSFVVRGGRWSCGSGSCPIIWLSAWYSTGGQMGGSIRPVRTVNAE